MYAKVLNMDSQNLSLENLQTLNRQVQCPTDDLPLDWNRFQFNGPLKGRRSPYYRFLRTYTTMTRNTFRIMSPTTIAWLVYDIRKWLRTLDEGIPHSGEGPVRKTGFMQKKRKEKAKIKHQSKPAVFRFPPPNTVSEYFVPKWERKTVADGEPQIGIYDMARRIPGSVENMRQFAPIHKKLGISRIEYERSDQFRRVEMRHNVKRLFAPSSEELLCLVRTSHTQKELQGKLGEFMDYTQCKFFEEQGKIDEQIRVFDVARASRKNFDDVRNRTCHELITNDPQTPDEVLQLMSLHRNRFPLRWLRHAKNIYPANITSRFSISNYPCTERMEFRRSFDWADRPNYGDYYYKKDPWDYENQRVVQHGNLYYQAVQEEVITEDEEYEFGLQTLFAEGIPHVFGSRMFSGLDDSIESVTGDITAIRSSIENTSSRVNTAAEKFTEFMTQAQSILTSLPAKFESVTSNLGTITDWMMIVIDLLNKIIRKDFDFVSICTMVVRILRLLNLTKYITKATSWVAQFSLFSEKQMQGRERQLRQDIKEHYENFPSGTENMFEDGEPHAGSDWLTFLVGILGAGIIGCLPTPARCSHVVTLLRGAIATSILFKMMPLEDLILKVVENVPEIMGTWIKTLCPKAMFLAKLRDNDPVFEWAGCIDALDNSDCIARMMYDRVLQQKVRDLRNQSFVLRKRVAIEEMFNAKDNNFVVKANERLQIMAKVVEMHTNVSSVREAPFVVAVSGRPGVGKSVLTNVLVHALFEEDELESHKDNLIYTRNEAMKHWDRYCSNLCLVYDDFGQFRKSASETDCFTELICIASNAIYQLPMASLEDKGTIFKTPLVVLNTNVPFLEPLSLQSREALWRRRNAVLKVTVPRTVLKNPNNLDSGVDSDKIDPAHPLDHYTFRLLDPCPVDGAEHVLAGPFNWQQMIVVLKPMFQKHRAQQKMVLNLKDSRYTHRMEMTAPVCAAYEALEVVEERTPDHMAEIVDEEDEAEAYYDKRDPITHDPKKWKFLSIWNRKNEVVVDEGEPHCGCEKCIRHHVDSDTGPCIFIDDDEEDFMSINGEPISERARRFRSQFRERTVQDECRDKRFANFYQWAAMITGVVGGFMIGYAVTGLLIHAYRAIFGTPHSGEIRTAAMAKVLAPVVIAHAGDTHVGNGDPNARELCSVVANSTVYVSHLGPTGVRRFMNGTFVKGRVLMMPYHFFLNPETLEPWENDELIEIKDSKGVEYKELFCRERLFRVADHKDVALYVCSRVVKVFRDIMQHFMTEEDLKFVRKFSGTLVNVSLDNVVYHTLPTVTPLDVKEFRYSLNKEKNPELFVMRTGWNYNAQFHPGDCGGLLVANGPTIRRKLVGMHVAGYVHQVTGVSEIITFEMLNKIFKQLEQGFPQVGEAKIPIEVVETVGNAAIIPAGNFTLNGVLPLKLSPRNPTKTDIIPSLFHGEITMPITGPSVLHPHDERLAPEQFGKSVLLRGVNKYGKIPQSVPPAILKQVEDFLYDEFCTVDGPILEKRLLTMEEAINGVPSIPHCEPLHMATSPGWPYVFRRPNGSPDLLSGKKFLFNLRDGNWSVADMELQAKLLERETEALKGQRVVSVWIDQLKDERRLLEKILKGSTRVFTMAPVDYTIVARKYCLLFEAHCIATRIKTSSIWGVNPNSREWGDLFAKLRTISNYGFCGDYECFDGGMPPEILFLTCKIMNRWYNDSPENQRVREILFEELIQTNQQVMNLNYFTHIGNPSGCPFTTLINTIAGRAYTVWVWIVASRNFPSEIPRDLVTFRKMVACGIYGDDIQVSAHLDLEPYYNIREFNTVLNPYNIRMTMPDKSEGNSTYDLVEKGTLLKTGYRVLGNNVYPMFDHNVAFEIMNWIRKTDEPILALQENCNSALRIFFFYGPRLFNSTRRYIQKVALRKGLQLDLYQFADLFVEFEAKGFAFPPEFLETKWRNNLENMKDNASEPRDVACTNPFKLLCETWE